MGKRTNIVIHINTSDLVYAKEWRYIKLNREEEIERRNFKPMYQMLINIDEYNNIIKLCRSDDDVSKELGYQIMLDKIIKQVFKDSILIKLTDDRFLLSLRYEPHLMRFYLFIWTKF